MAQSRVFYPGIHALRAVAAIAVIYSHAEFVAQAYGGIVYERRLPLAYLGVILFFAISGFVIALNRRRGIGEFVLHRLLRIYPSYWLAILIEVTAFAAIGGGKAVTPASLFLYPSATVNDATAIPYWTLAFEVTFYALASLAFALRLSDRTLTIIAVGWIVAVNLFAASPNGPDYLTAVTAYSFPGFPKILLSSAVQVFPMGLLCGIHFATLRHASRWIYAAAAVMALVASFGFPFDWFATKHLLTLGIAASCLVLAVADLDLGSRIVTLLGNASYGIYLMHFPAMVFAASLAPGLAHLGFGYFFTVALIAGTGFGLLDHRLYRTLAAASRPWFRRPQPAG